jgi:endonuclease/exonuclease/phosphatase family metal-dependent hydrolase
MKKLLTILFFFIILHSAVMSQSFTVATYNLRYASPNDSGNLWTSRASVVANLIRFHDFDIFGTQEGLKHQLDDLIGFLPEYERTGVGRDDGIQKGEHAAIFFKRDRFIKLTDGDFWLSQTPSIPSIGWDGKCCKRICSWIKLKDKASGREFFVFNAHYDHEGELARQESSKLVLQKIRELSGGLPVIFTGDLNGGHESACYLLLALSGLLEDSFAKVEHPYANNGTFNGFKPVDPQNKEIIDHIFVTKHFGVNKWGVLTDSYGGKYPSDHFPVLSVVKFK